MASQKEHLDSATVPELKQFADEHEVDLQGASTKPEIVDTIAASKTPSADEVKAAFPLDAEEDVEDEEGDEEETEEEQIDTTGADAAGESRAMRHSVSGDRTVRAPEATLDLALVDPAAAAQERAGGRTSDPANRVEGVNIADVPPDINEGAKPSDGGSEAYPFPPGGDVDVALIDPAEHDGEYPAPLNVDDWVVLDGAHELVPDRLDGHIAYVVTAPNETAPDVHDHPNAALTPVPDGAVTVKTRDEVNATLYLPMDAFKAVGKGGRSSLLPIG